MMHWIACLEGGPRRVNHAAAAVGPYIYSFGGYCTGEDSNEIQPMDVHVLNTATLRWRRLPLKDADSEAVPFQRYGHTAVAHGKKIYVWGGRNDEFACNMLYCFDTTTGCWETPKVKGEVPGPRDGHSACLSGHRMYIFGGFEEELEVFSQDVYVLDLNEMCWSNVFTLGTPPTFRDFHSAVVLNNRMYVFGGRGDRPSRNYVSEGSYSSHVMYLDFESGRWNKPFTFGDKPTGRRSHSAFIHAGFMYIFGGYNGNMRKHFNHLYQFNPISFQWKLVNATGKSPCERRRQSCIVVGNRMFLFGGTSPQCRRRTDTVNSDDSDYDEVNDLMDHSDLHVLDFNPTLKTLSMLVVIRYGLDTHCLPISVQNEINMMTIPNNITTPFEKNMEEFMRI